MKKIRVAVRGFGVVCPRREAEKGGDTNCTHFHEFLFNFTADDADGKGC